MRRSMIALSSTCLFAVVLFGGVAPATYAADESVTVVARLYASPGREAELEARLLKVVEFVRKAEPNITYRLHRSKKDPSVFLFYEVYPSQAAFDKHSKETLPAFRKEFGPPAEGLFARPNEVEFFRGLAD